MSGLEYVGTASCGSPPLLILTFEIIWWQFNPGLFYLCRQKPIDTIPPASTSSLPSGFPTGLPASSLKLQAASPAAASAPHYELTLQDTHPVRPPFPCKIFQWPSAWGKSVPPQPCIGILGCFLKPQVPNTYTCLGRSHLKRTKSERYMSPP